MKQIRWIQYVQYVRIMNIYDGPVIVLSWGAVKMNR